VSARAQTDAPAPGTGTAALYVITGSHACRTAMLMLEHKGITFRRVVLPTGLHPMLVRACGFPGHSTPIRTVDGATHRELALLDRMGTVPALRLGAERVQTNRAIARFLDRVAPEPALFPADADSRLEVERAESWADEVLQMAARRAVLATPVDELSQRGGKGRLGPLLTSSDWARPHLARMAGRSFRAGSAQQQRVLESMPGLFDQIDYWVEQGVLGGPELNAADFTIAPSLALLSYRADLSRSLSGRPAGALRDRLLPEPP
jgi:glutathione S-transferase